MKNLKLYLVSCFIMSMSCIHAQKKTFSFDDLFAKHAASFDSIIQNKAGYRLQIIYTRIDRDKKNVPHLTTYTYDADKYYYYCASLIKFPASCLTLEKLNDLKQYNISMTDSLSIDSIGCGSLNRINMMLGTPYSCLAQYIKEMLMISNNNAFNPVYDFLGQRFFQDRLHELGYHSAVISHRFAECDTNQNRLTDPVSLYDRTTHQLKYHQAAITNQRRHFYNGELSPLVGKGYFYGGQLINQPKDFRFANYIALSDLHKLLTKVIFPQTQSPSEKLNLRHSDYQYIYKCMGMFPREAAFPRLDPASYPDQYMNYFMGPDTGASVMPPGVRTFNKVGQAYGFMSDISYIVDTVNKVEFFISCSMYLNKDEIINDNKYEYDITGYPFFHNLYSAIYEEELARHKKYLPKFQLPDFTDTPLIKPNIGKQVDSTHSIAEAEAVLCRLADSMWYDRRLYINYDNPTADEVFYRNLAVALRMRVSINYPFDRLKEKNISIITSDDKRLRVFSWDKDSHSSNFALFQFIDGQHMTLLKSADFIENKTLPKMIYTNIYQVKSSNGPIYLLLAQTSKASGQTQYLQAYGWENNAPAKLKIFNYHNSLYTNLLAEKRTGKEQILYNAKRQLVKYPMIIKTGAKFKTKTVRLKFDGMVFK